MTKIRVVTLCALLSLVGFAVVFAPQGAAGVSVLSDTRMLSIRAASCDCPPNMKVIGTVCAAGTNGVCTGKEGTNCKDACGEDYCDEYYTGSMVCGPWPNHPDNGCKIGTGTKDCGDKWKDGKCKLFDPGIGYPDDGCWCQDGTEEADGCSKLLQAEACTP